MSSRKQIIIGSSVAVIGAILLSLLVGAFNFTRNAWNHVDADTPVSAITTRQSDLRTRVDEHEGYEVAITEAVDELKKLRQALVQRRVSGRATREVGTLTIGENRIYVNTNSDAREFDYDEQVEITVRGRGIRALVKGTMFDERQDVLFKMNRDTAEELGITTQQGIAEVTIQRILTDEQG